MEEEKKPDAAAAADDNENATKKSSETAVESETLADDSVRWMAALAYLPLICLAVLFFYREDPFIQRHARQGLILFVIILLALLLKLDIIWNLIIAACVAVALVGAVSIILRGDIKIPLLSDLAEKLHFRF